MINSPTHQYYEIDDYCGYECDPQLDFAKFLKEAKALSGIDAAKHETKCVQVQVEEEFGTSRRKKKKKSWGRWMFSWLKAEMKMTKSPAVNDALNASYHISSKPTTCCYFSGPVNGGGCSRRSNKSTSSGPLLGLFNLTKKPENEDDKQNKLPYMCIQNTPSVQSYGPVYLVT